RRRAVDLPQHGQDGLLSGPGQAAGSPASSRGRGRRMRHEKDHEELLEAIVTGGVREDDPRAKDRLAGCAGCREQLAELRELGALLDEVAREEHDTIREALGPEWAHEPVRTARRRAPTRTSTAPGTRSLRWTLPFAAAAVLLIGFVLWSVLTNARRK